MKNEVPRGKKVKKNARIGSQIMPQEKIGSLSESSLTGLHQRQAWLGFPLRSIVSVSQRVCSKSN